jgi:uncharacterized membrane protein
MIEPLLIAAIVIACITWYAQHRWRRRARELALFRETAGLDVLAERYARGEIGRQEFLEKREDILAGVSLPRL